MQSSNGRLFKGSLDWLNDAWMDQSTMSEYAARIALVDSSMYRRESVQSAMQLHMRIMTLAVRTVQSLVTR